MAIGEGDVILTFRVAVPLDRPHAFNLRDLVILALVPLGVRVEKIDPSTVVRMKVDESALAALTAVPDDDGAPLTKLTS
jgi:hypothetical protein